MPRDTLFVLASSGPLTTDELKEHIDACLIEFGKHSYYDKGPDETTDIDTAERRARSMDMTDLRAVLVPLKAMGDPYESFVNSLVCGLEDLPDEEFEKLMAGGELEDY